MLGTAEDWLKVVVPHLVLADCFESMKFLLSLSCPVVALAYKSCNRQQLDLREFAIWRHTTHLCAGYSNKWNVSPQVQGNSVAALGCQLRDNGLWVYKVPVCRI